MLLTALCTYGFLLRQDPELKPRVVHRGLEGLPEIPDGEVPEVDHLVFVVHGIGSACDIKFRKITEVSNIASQSSLSYYVDFLTSSSRLCPAIAT